MKTIFHWLGVLVVAAAVAVGVHAATPAAPTAPAASGRYGALAGPDIASPYLRWGGVVEYRASGSLKAATTTVCALQSPSATSTLQQAGVRIDVASSTATIWDIAEATTPYATTTAIGSAYTVGAGAQAFIQASTSPAAGAKTVLAPNTWIVFGVRQGITAGDAGTGFVPSGACQAAFTAY